MSYRKCSLPTRSALYWVAAQITYSTTKMQPIFVSTVVFTRKPPASSNLLRRFSTCKFHTLFPSVEFDVECFRFPNVDLRLMLIPALPRPGARYASRLPFILEHFKAGTKNEVAVYKDESNRLARNLKILKIIEILPGEIFKVTIIFACFNHCLII